MEVDETEVNAGLTDAFFAAMNEVVEMVARAAKDDPNSELGIPADLFPTTLLSLSIYIYDIMESKADEEVTQRFLQACEGFKAQVGKVLFGMSGLREMSPSWHPDELLSTATSPYYVHPPVESYSMYPLNAHLVLGRYFARISAAAKRHLAAIFESSPEDLQLHLLSYANDIWMSIADNADATTNVTQLIAFYDHLDRFSENFSPLPKKTTLQPSTTTSYPQPHLETASQAPLALLDSFEYFGRASGYFSKENLQSRLLCLDAALVLVCCDHSDVNAEQVYSYVPTPEFLEHKKRIEDYKIGDKICVWFDQLCEASKATKAEKKRHYYMGWLEKDSLFKFSWVWKTLPAPAMFQKMENAELEVAALMVRWSKQVTPEWRIKVALTTFEHMCKACEITEDAKEHTKNLANVCLPHLLWLLPIPPAPIEMEAIDPITTFLLLIPDLMTIVPKIVDFLKTVVAAFLRDETGGLPAKYREYAEIKDKVSMYAHHTAFRKSTFELAPTATEIVKWAPYRATVDKNRTFTSASRILAAQLAEYPEAARLMITSIVRHCAVDKVPLLAILLKCAYTSLQLARCGKITTCTPPINDRNR